MNSAVSSDFKLPRLLLCEGPHDAGFFRALIASRNLKEFHIRCPTKEAGYGISGFGKSLLGFTVITGFEKIADIVIVGDNDDDPTASFNAICDQITGAGFSAPTQSNLMVPGTPNVHVMMVPSPNLAGSLESLCYTAASNANAQVAACVQAYEQCLAIGSWQEQKKAKMRLRSILAGSYRKNPDILFSRVWQEEPSLIPLSDAIFDPLANFLAAIN